ncbi:glutathione S-transferase family protein [Corallococcus exiguus]|uniref:glutathione S-transferase family protein n=1 Tax=Corallococcus TaxID=83461 RepID=UPI000EEEAE79|nr:MULTISPECIES: glutathione S-transferase family protein [Corallococcus]NNB86612.1 glutathione S-transferase family protein [Corallococcus exiguus]NNB92855.1 glutathione S-transferase family protein [Corallococcus exiguus]NNC01421.1 glutathione S-transferase family protein [Corallococcus exiguus]NPC47735.1 glutathione S-transferase family protein [Corallococcus exiguus]RKH77870.1 glutathione S-transferase family protein [Corallococcus sp. AB032C]
MKLYFALRTRAVRPRWLLEELGVPYELVRLDLARQENTTPEYLAVHPLGDLPALVDGDVTLLESLSICLHLADRFPEKHLAPPVGSAERGPYYGWMAFAELSLDPLVMEFYRDAQSPVAREVPEGEAAKLRTRLTAALDLIQGGLGGREFLVGEAFTAADVVMASILHLANTLMLLDGYPELVAYVRRHSQRPAVRRAVSG